MFSWYSYVLLVQLSSVMPEQVLCKKLHHVLFNEMHPVDKKHLNGSCYDDDDYYYNYYTDEDQNEDEVDAVAF